MADGVEERIKKRIAPYQAFVKNVLQRTELATRDAVRRPGEPLPDMLGRVLDAVDATLEKARAAPAAPAAAPAAAPVAAPPPAPKKEKKPELPVVWRESDGRKYPASGSSNWRTYSWDMQFPPDYDPIEVGREVFIKHLRRTAIVVGYSPGMKKNCVMLLLKKAAQRPLDVPVRPNEMRSWSRDSVLANLRNPPAAAPAAAPVAVVAEPDIVGMDEPPTYWRDKYLDLEVQLTAVQEAAAEGRVDSGAMLRRILDGEDVMDELGVCACDNT
tara:strand:+ start:626 stop:1438 length:813 start_codon:yes stop_codon:yes gene_type:complete